MPQLLKICCAFATCLPFVAACGDSAHSTRDDGGVAVDAVGRDATVPDVLDHQGTHIIWTAFNRGIPVYPEAWHSGRLGVKTVTVENDYVEIIKPLTECGGRRHVFRSTLSSTDKDRIYALSDGLRSFESISASCGCLGDCALEQVQIITDEGVVVIAASPALRVVAECSDQAAASQIPVEAVALADALRQQAVAETVAAAEVTPRRIKLGRIVPPDGVFPDLVAAEWPFSQIDVLNDISNVESRPYVVADPALAHQIWQFFDRAEAAWPAAHACERGLFVTVTSGQNIAHVAASPFVGDVR